MSIFYSENTTSRLPIPASGITDANLILDVLHSGSERSLTLAELKKTGPYVINVKQYGAVGDGTTDDWAAIQSAIDDASGNTYTAGVATVFLPPGRYLISRPLYITDTVVVTGAGWHATVIDGTGILDTFCILVTGNYSSLENMSIRNVDGSGAAWILGGYKGSAKNLWVGGTIKDIAFLNAGCQQLRWENLWASSNGRRVTPGSTYPKVGFSCTSLLKYGTAIADITNTGLNGKTLSFQFVGSYTVTVSGNHVRDAVDAINTKTIDSGLVAAYTNENELVIAAVGYDDATDGANCDNDMIFSNGTGLWSALGMTATTYTTGDTIGVTNGSQIFHCHAEGCTKYGLIIDSRRHTDSKRGYINLLGGVFQGNSTTDIVIKDSRYVNMHGVYVEPSADIVLLLDKADYFSTEGCITSNASLIDTHGATFIGTNITKIAIDEKSSQTTFIACNISTSLTDRGTSTKFINCSTEAYPDTSGNIAIGNNIGSSCVLNKNTLLTYPSPAGVDTPWGFVKEGPTTTTRVSGVEGTYAYEVNHQSWADYGLSYTIPSGDIAKTSSQVKQQLSIFTRVKRTNAAARTSNEVGIIVEFNDVGATIYRQISDVDNVDEEYPLNEWVEKTFQFNIVPGHGDIKVTLTPSAYGGTGLAQIIVDAFVISIGDVAKSTSAGTGEFKKLLISGIEILSGSGAPTTGEYLKGSIVMNNNPSGGGMAGWICTTAGTPGTWKTFGVISP